MSTEPTTTQAVHTAGPRCAPAPPLLALCGVTAGGVSLAAASDGDRHRPRTLEVDIAEDGTRFVIDEAPVFDDGFPAYGNPFITQGYIYPAGTLTDSNGVNPDGIARVPRQGHRRVVLPAATSSPTAPTPPKDRGCSPPSSSPSATTPTPDATPSSSPATKAPRSAEIVTGAITGGTGRYATARGEADQELLGINNPELPTMGINKTVELEIER